MLAGVLLVATGCSSDEAAEVVTTSAPSTTVAPTTTVEQQEIPPTTVPARQLPSYEVVESVTTDEGSVLVVLLPEGSYDDIDIENLMLHMVDEFSPVGIHVVDDLEAAELVLDEEADPADPVLTEHYLARLEDGNRVVFVGPLAEFGWFLVGS